MATVQLENDMEAIEHTRKQIINYLNDLEKLRWHYILSLWFPFLKNYFFTQEGLCCAYRGILRKEQNHNALWDTLYHFAERQKGFISMPIQINNFYAYNTDYCWFKLGKIRPRLKVLNQTIEYYRDIYDEKYGD